MIVPRPHLRIRAPAAAPPRQRPARREVLESSCIYSRFAVLTWHGGGAAGFRVGWARGVVASHSDVPGRRSADCRRSSCRRRSCVRSRARSIRVAANCRSSPPREGFLGGKAPRLGKPLDVCPSTRVHPVRSGFLAEDAIEDTGLAHDMPGLDLEGAIVAVERNMMLRPRARLRLSSHVQCVR
jgi:hypothetical protein